ncbi:MAG: peroxiredoxin family protein [Achromobacter sp.]|uniref:peroxiredoxin family protein n=1 Tax=Achromobacter sp. TaxID=134375 RepID=UPI003CFBC404
MLHDRNSSAARKWNAVGLPANYLVDRGGSVRHWHLGALDWQAERITRAVTGMLRA